MIKDGLYFGLPADQYHALDALSASGIKHLLVSPPDYWMRSPKNPLRRDEQTEAMFVGTAFHKRILEGRDAFYAGYAQSFEAPADCLRTVDDIKDALIKCGIEKPNGLKAELIEKLIDLQPSVQIYDELKANHEVRHHGKQFLSADLLQSIEISAAMIERHPTLSKCFRGGYPEISVIWTEDGVRFKARLDYLKPSVIVDLKTFANPMSMPIDAAVYRAMATNKNHIQASFYLRAFEKAREFCKWDGRVYNDDFHFNDKWTKEFTSCEDPKFYFLFQQKGVAPLARLYRFPKDGAYQSGVAAIEHAIQIYKQCQEKYGNDAWLDDAPPQEFSDALFPMYMTEI